ncbi:MAG: DNA primase [Alphaproteobacteria bacterium]|nr:MAG: DNA primase [Alphaproteobacteria bacterium]
MSLSPHFLDELRNRLTLSEIIGRRIKVTRAGRESKACCPFHSEKSPSFTINDDKQFYHCFGCGAHGDVIGFIMKHDNLAFMDAVETLAAEAGMQVPKQTPQAAAKAKKEKDLYELLEDTTVFFEQHLRDSRNADALNYLLERGLSQEIIAEFKVGFAPDDGQALRKFLSAKDYTDKDMIKAGVLRPSTRGGDPYAFFRDRVMFPVPDRRGRTVAFGGRILPDHLRPPQRGDFVPPKYINSSETVLFHKGSMLYGEPTARRAAADGQTLVLVEGYLDVIACAQAGIRGALAPMGTAVTEEQLISMWKMIPDFTKIPLLCFDGDNAGRKAARRASERLLPLLEPGRSVNFAFMPDGEDPDSLIKSSGVKGFQKILGSSVSLFDFIWNFYTQGRVFKTPELRAGVIKQLENEVAHVANQEVQVHYKSQLREKVSETFFKRKEYGFKKRDFGGYGKSRNQGGAVIPMRPPSTKNRATRIFTHALLAAVINHPHIFEGVEDALCELTLSDVALDRLRQNIMGILSDDPLIERKVLIEQLKNSGFAQEIGDICNESVYVHASFCSPSAKEEDVQSSWLKSWQDGHSAGLGNEIQSGWKNVSCEEDEEKLRNLLLMKTSDDEI